MFGWSSWHMMKISSLSCCSPSFVLTRPRSRHLTANFSPVSLCVILRTTPETPEPSTGPSCTPSYTSSIGLSNDISVEQRADMKSLSFFRLVTMSSRFSMLVDVFIPMPMPMLCGCSDMVLCIDGCSVLIMPLTGSSDPLTGSSDPFMSHAALSPSLSEAMSCVESAPPSVECVVTGVGGAGLGLDSCSNCFAEAALLDVATEASGIALLLLQPIIISALALRLFLDLISLSSDVPAIVLIL
mmetsp:Transcript_19141/g.28129  ORF Transcript_19141/g.28129 Transcript_19141/m.28129 type:complete len:242 (-) Transcript_19141:28-753(-)